MKKLFAVLLALCVVGSAFAQVTINGYNRTLASFDKDMSATLANRLRLNGSFKGEDGTFGVGFRLQSDAFAAPATKLAWGWASLLDGKLKVTAGQFGYYDYQIGTGFSEWNLGNVQGGDLCQGDATKGMLFQVMPVEGLNIGVNYIPGSDIDGADFKAGFSYTIADVGKVVASTYLADDIMVGGAFQFTGVEGLEATVGGYYGGNGFYYGYVAEQITVLGIINYSADALTVEVAPVYNVTDGKIYAEGFVSYKVSDALTAGVLGAYDQAGTALGSAAAPSTFFFGAEAYYKVGKATLQSGVNFDDADGLSIPLMVKVGF
jgi:hypothetical protein